MEPSDIRKMFLRHRGVRAAANRIAKLTLGNSLFLEGLQGSSAAACFSALPDLLPAPQLFLVILNDESEATAFHGDLETLLGEGSSLYFPSPYKRGVRYAQIDPANEILRTDVLGRLASLDGSPSSSMFVVTYPEALAVKVVTQDTVRDACFNVEVGKEYDFARIGDQLTALGFRHADYVYEPGEFAVRGSILDVFSYSNDCPFRIDFFGDEIDSIRTFDVQTQLSIEKVSTASLVPFVSSSPHSRVSFFNFLPDSTVLVQKNPAFVRDMVGKIFDAGFSEQALIERAVIQGEEKDGVSELDANSLLLDGTDFARGQMKYSSVVLATKPAGVKGESVQFHTSPQPKFHKNFDLIGQTLSDFNDRGYKIYIFADSDKQHERLKEIFSQSDHPVAFQPVSSTIHSGFADDTLKVCLFTDHQIFDRFHKYQIRSGYARNGKVAHSLRELNQFAPGDYVTHIDHGIGQFVGLVRVEKGGVEQEMMKLLYKDGDIVYVSVHALSKVSKYKPGEGETPRLSKLGTGSWHQLKERTKKKIKDIARDLIKLYSERRQQEGFAYSPDSYMQHELEASFAYEDTPDQLTVTSQIKTDMESKRPMDRLVCGDVGFGKTELAVRAAFKAAADSKQVAVLVPTTVLAYQHYQTFKERLKDFPVTVEYLSRSRTPKQTKEICERLKDGKIEIIIGTQKLLGKSVVFKDLGLLIIDEEQKFGVATKEKLRQMKVNVDTLTLTATPIPRTLQFSLMGARDLSVLSTPPANRHPIQTEIHVFGHEIIADAINFEMSRGGQVFFVCNRIAQIPHVESLIHEYVPDARVAVGHGRMSPEALEKIILDFINREYDVLLSTTIVENGIDIPNANTIIIDNAQNFGLSDLHQMRGRVGRSNRKAFCYLLAPPAAALSDDSRHRLEAIESFSDLGSGIQIAMQDLDIRGAGNLLGAEQSGFIADLGYETYQKILSEAVSELKTEEFADLYADEAEQSVSLQGELFVGECSLDSDLPLYLPEEYIPGTNERVLCYREIDSLSSDALLADYRKKLEDRFGALPEPAENLLKVPVVRRLGRSLGIERIVVRSGVLTLYYVSNLSSAFYQSDTFGRSITYMADHYKTCKLSEQNKKRRLTIQNISNIDQVLSVLNGISTSRQ
jgi:transcription-repair coupling factor (superfamily II helicase)